MAASKTVPGYGQDGKIAYDPGKCIEAITSPGDWWNHQCKRKPLPGDKYCKAHGPERVEAKRTAEHRVWRLESDERILRADVDTVACNLANAVLERDDADMLAVAIRSEVAAYRRARARWDATRLALAEARQALKEFKS